MGVINRSALCSAILILFLLMPPIGSSNSQLFSMSKEIDYLIITCNDFLEEVQPLAIWKLRKGLIPAIETVEDITSDYEGDNLAEKIRACVIYYYQEFNITWVVLAGGHGQVPSSRALVETSVVSCDQYYSNLDDNWYPRPNNIVRILNASDWDAEVYVGRLPADDEGQMTTLVNHLIEYETNPPVGSWMTNALFCGAFCNFDTDYNDNDILDSGDFPEFDSNRNHNWINDNIIPDYWTASILAEGEGVKTSDYYYDQALNSSTLKQAIEQGVCIMMSDAHGSTTGTFRLIFTEDQDGDLLFDPEEDVHTSVPFLSTDTTVDVEGKLGFYFLCACSTGTFHLSTTCLSEHIVRNFGIGCIASSESASYDPSWYDGQFIGWSTQGLASRFWEQLLAEGINQPARAFIEAKLDYVEDFEAYEGEAGLDPRALVQYNLMGDPEVNIWTQIPDVLVAETLVDEISGAITVRALSDQKPVQGALVTLLNSDSYFREVTDQDGEVILPQVITDVEAFDLTISKNHYLPYQNLSSSITTLPANLTIINSVTSTTSATTSTSTENSLSTSLSTSTDSTTPSPSQYTVEPMFVILGIGAPIVVVGVVFFYRRK